jgi:hypothetical protein
MGQWNACVEFLPMWLAPNMVTLLGFFAILFNVLLLTIFDPGMDSQVRTLHLQVPYTDSNMRL